jgi:hypothetical protein
MRGGLSRSSHHGWADARRVVLRVVADSGWKVDLACGNVDLDATVVLAADDRGWEFCGLRTTADSPVG